MCQLTLRSLLTTCPSCAKTPPTSDYPIRGGSPQSKEGLYFRKLDAIDARRHEITGDGSQRGYADYFGLAKILRCETIDPPGRKLALKSAECPCRQLG
jgi:hypothetical protein